MPDETMRAVCFADYGPPTNLAVAEVPRPAPGERQVLVSVHATGVHPFDTKLRSGLLRDFVPLALPYTPGIDCAGVVAEVGPGVNTFKPGDAIFGRAMGAYAEYAIADVTNIARKPEALSFEQAAALPVGAGTAWAAVIDTAKVASAQRVLVHGGAGGVGMYAVQLAHWKGAHVIATTSAANADFVRSLGADQVIDYTAEQFDHVVHDVDAVVDTVGGDVIERSLKVIKPGGILVTIAGRPPEEAAAALGVRAVAAQGAANGERLAQIAEMVVDGTIKVEVGRVFPLADAGAAHALSETGHGRGRIVLRVASD